MHTPTQSTEVSQKLTATFICPPLLWKQKNNKHFLLKVQSWHQTCYFCESEQAYSYNYYKLKHRYWINQESAKGHETYLEHSINVTFSRPSVKRMSCMQRSRSSYSSGGNTWNGKNGLNLKNIEEPYLNSNAVNNTNIQK